MMIQTKVKSESTYDILENEIYNKIIKYNYNNNFDMMDVYLQNYLTNEIFKSSFPKFKNQILIKSSIVGKINKQENLNEFKKIFEEFLKDNSIIDDKDVFNLLSMNRILDDSYIFEKSYYDIYLKESAILNIYQYGEFDNKTFLCLKLLEILMNIQFTINDLIEIDLEKNKFLKNIKNFSQGLMINEGKMLVNN
jgi:hypothetical protein